MSTQRPKAIRQDLLPDRFPFTTKGWRVDSIEVMAAGSLADGREFQEIRIIFGAPEERMRQINAEGSDASERGE